MSNSDCESNKKSMVTAAWRSLKIAERWKTGRLTPQIDVTSSSTSSTADTAGLVQDPLDLFQLFCNDEFFVYIKQQSKIYAKQKNPTCSFEVSADELKIFIAILLLSGYSTFNCQETCTGVWMQTYATKQLLLPCRETNSEKFCGIYTSLTTWMLQITTSTLKFDLSLHIWMISTWHSCHRMLDLLGFIRSVASSLLLLTTVQLKGRSTTATKPLVRKVPESVRSNNIVVHHPVNVKQGRCKVCQKNTTLGCGVCRMNMHPVICDMIFHELRTSNETEDSECH